MLPTHPGPKLAPLADPNALTAFRGGPFEEGAVTAAGAGIRTECGWHIAPNVEQTIALRTGGADEVLLPSLHVTEVKAVTDRYGNPVTGWDAWAHGVLARPGGFPDAILVTYSHGYETCPAELLPIIAERAAASASGRIKAEALAGRSVQLEGGEAPATEASIAAYRIGA